MTEKLSERSEFFSVPETSAERRGPAGGGQGRLGAFFWLLFFGRAKRVTRRRGAKPPGVDRRGFAVIKG